MREIFETCEALHDGLIPAEALRASGMNSHAVDSLLKRGELVRVRRGCDGGGMSSARAGRRSVQMVDTASSFGRQRPRPNVT
ncbi:type IV toxin-antitoxin system AbiEi family antitoxin domain-containing protein [Cryobacterium sp. N19]|uniref:type IV toxin-antitoxin system AbiEi family antitoxin domain-containing protein n=1 Tax=Cryobacterium sp. N19 TaxID=2048288 RepID=UPI000CE2D1B7|nr:type IV toxin-antitoxin system AbiEi family antitoxin domain-containing protein [Cryobacterium sp. N19]